MSVFDTPPINEGYLGLRYTGFDVVRRTRTPGLIFQSGPNLLFSRFSTTPPPPQPGYRSTGGDDTDSNLPSISAVTADAATPPARRRAANTFQPKSVYLGCQAFGRNDGVPVNCTVRVTARRANDGGAAVRPFDFTFGVPLPSPPNATSQVFAARLARQEFPARLGRVARLSFEVTRVALPQPVAGLPPFDERNTTIGLDDFEYALTDEP